MLDCRLRYRWLFAALALCLLGVWPAQIKAQDCALTPGANQLVLLLSDIWESDAEPTLPQRMQVAEIAAQLRGPDPNDPGLTEAASDREREAFDAALQVADQLAFGVEVEWDADFVFSMNTLVTAAGADCPAAYKMPAYISELDDLFKSGGGMDALRQINDVVAQSAETVVAASGSRRLWVYASAIVTGLLFGLLVFFLAKSFFEDWRHWLRVLTRRQLTCRVRAFLELDLDVVDGAFVEVSKKGCRFQFVNPGAAQRGRALLPDLPGDVVLHVAQMVIAAKAVAFDDKDGLSATFEGKLSLRDRVHLLRNAAIPVAKKKTADKKTKKDKKNKVEDEAKDPVQAKGSVPDSADADQPDAPEAAAG